MSKIQNRIAVEYIEVLKTLYDSGNITRQAMKSIRGQIITMQPESREEYLKKIIKRTSCRSKRQEGRRRTE